MNRNLSIYVTAIFTLLILASLPFAGQAQSIWLDEPTNTSQVGIELMIPSYDDFNPEGAAFASYLYTHLPVSNKLALEFDVPVSHFSDGGGESNFAIGNPYVGIEYQSSASTRWEFGVRAPAVTEYENALITGFDVENYKVGPFIPDAFSIVTNVHHYTINTNGFGYKIGGGLEGLIPTEGNGDSELYAKLYGQLLYAVDDHLTLGGGVNILGIATSSGGSFADRTVPNAALSASYDFGKFELGGYLERSLDDDINDFLNFTGGLNLRVSF